MRNLDIFLGEQLPNGAFAGVVRGTPTKDLDSDHIKGILEHDRLPMSDIGSMVSAMAVGSVYAKGKRKKAFEASVKHFCENWAMQFQLADGSFTDGQWHPYDGKPYSCATAILSATFSLAHRIVGEESYLDVAARAARHMIGLLQPDGRMRGCGPHWEVRGGKPFVLESLYFGDGWYYDEGFITTWHHTQDTRLKRNLQETIMRRVTGSEGLLHALGDSVWWPIQNTWNNAKSVGMMQTLLHAQAAEKHPARLKHTLAGMRKVLCTPEYARCLGVMAEDYEWPESDFRGESWVGHWGGFSREATGFAGMSLAEIIKPGLIYLT